MNRMAAVSVAVPVDLSVVAEPITPSLSRSNGLAGSMMLAMSNGLAPVVGAA